MGITVHSIDPSTYIRIYIKASLKLPLLVHELLAIVSTYDVLAAKIKNVHKNFGPSGKVSATVTDNGSNFVRAFATFHFQMFPLHHQLLKMNLKRNKLLTM